MGLFCTNQLHKEKIFQMEKSGKNHPKELKGFLSAVRSFLWQSLFVCLGFFLILVLKGDVYFSKMNSRTTIISSLFVVVMIYLRRHWGQTFSLRK